MNTPEDLRGKEIAPDKTVERIKTILDQYGFESTYAAGEPQLETCYSSRVSVNTFGSNGKGLSDVFCMASGYAELLERMQNKALSRRVRIHSEYYRQMLESFPADSLLDESSGCVADIKGKLISSAPEKKDVDDLVRQMSVEGKYILRPFYSVEDQCEVLLPYEFLQIFTGTNGMAAGNTLEEAIVQGLSEILERYVTMQILYHGLTPPEIPLPYLETHYPEIFQLVEEVKKDSRYTIRMLDASLGRGIPCAACIIYDTEKMTVGVKFGAYPDMKIAFERCFSEAMQGWTLETFARTGVVSFDRFSRGSWTNVMNIMKVSKGIYPKALFDEKSSWSFSPWEETSQMNNREKLTWLIRLIHSMGRRIYIQDVSFLDFPSVYIYVPDMSEVAPVDILWMQESALKRKCQDWFSHLQDISEEEIRQLLTLASIKQSSLLENEIGLVSCMAYRENMPGYPNEMGFLAALCLFCLGRYKEAFSQLGKTPNDPYVVAVRYYISMIDHGYSHEDAIRFLEQFSTAELAHKIAWQFEKKEQLLSRVYPACTGNCESCDLPCDQQKVHQDYERLLELELAHSVGTEDLERIFAQSGDRI